VTVADILARSTRSVVPSGAQVDQVFEERVGPGGIVSVLCAQPQLDRGSACPGHDEWLSVGGSWKVFGGHASRRVQELLDIFQAQSHGRVAG
jgi:hypothetical protein